MPVPSWPYQLSPQHFAAPSIVTPQVCVTPAASFATPFASPLTAVGVYRFAVVPSPSWPYMFSPQHFAASPVVRAQVCRAPAVMADTPEVSPLTHAGARRIVVVPSPTWPRALSPQHSTPPPADVSAQV